MNITVPVNYGYVLLASTLIGYQCHVTGFAAVQRPRVKIFNKKFMEENFGDEHRKEIGDEKLPDQGYPDMGSGRYSQKISYKEWYEFNCAQRAHQNQVESAATVISSCLIAGLKFPRLAAGLGASYFVGRLIYTIGYKKGPNQRELGAVMSHMSTFGMLGTAVLTAIKFIMKK